MKKKSLRQLFGSGCKIILLCLLIIAPVAAQPPAKSEDSLETLFQNFKTAGKAPCGQRAEAIRLGRRIIEIYSRDEINREVVEYVKKAVLSYEKTEESCKPTSYQPKLKSRSEHFFALKEIINNEDDSPLALDATLTLVAVGYDLAVIEKNNKFDDETIFYAELAIQKIEAGKVSSTQKWGMTQSFKTKDNSLAWMNYTIGYLTSKQRNPYYQSRQQELALTYFYKVLQFESDLRNKGYIYENIGNYYLDQTRNSPVNENASVDKVRGIANADRALIAFAKAYQSAVDNKVKKERIDALCKTIILLYKFRFNLVNDTKLDGLDEFIPKLVGRPLPDPTSPLEPVLEIPLEIKLKRNKLQ